MLTTPNRNKIYSNNDLEPNCVHAMLKRDCQLTDDIADLWW